MDSCQPNASWVMNPKTRAAEVRAVTAISEGQEIFLCYIPQTWRREHRQARLKHWGFECRCMLCQTQLSVPTVAEKRRISCNVWEYALASMEPPIDIESQIRVYELLVPALQEEEGMAWDLFVNATVLSSLYAGCNMPEKAAVYDRKAQEAAVVCYGPDFEMTDEFRQQVIKTMTLPKPDRCSKCGST
jgi:hypothetical protein